MMNNRLFRMPLLRWIIYLILFALTDNVIAQTQLLDRPITSQFKLSHTEIKHLRSSRIKQKFNLYISLPVGYKKSVRPYPVVYLLDADDSFAIAKGISDQLMESEELPGFILVGIGYGGPQTRHQKRLNRTRDYTPSFSAKGGYGPEYQKHSGGGPYFRDFIADTLIPYVDKNYRTLKGDRTLAGHSFGGLFGTYVLLTKSRLFKRYVLISPSLWYNDKSIFRLEEELSKRNKRLSAKVFFAVGAHERTSQRDLASDARTFSQILEARRYPSLKMRSAIFENENHNTIFPGAFSQGLRFVFGRLKSRY